MHPTPSYKNHQIKSSHKPLKIIIIGGGISGLLAAIALQNKYLIKVYEAKNFETMGGGFAISPLGINAALGLGLRHILERLSVKLNTSSYFDLQGHLLLRGSLQEFNQQTDNIMQTVGRTEFQQELLKELLPNTIYFQHKCVKVEESPNKVLVTFENGVQETADIVLATDGTNSIVRRVINPGVTPKTLNICVWGGILDTNHRADINNNELFFQYGINKTLWICPLSNNRQAWYIFCRMPAHELQYGLDKLSQIKKICANWSPTVDQVLAAPQNQHSFAVNVKEIPIMENWVSRHSRMVLMGDAAHGIGPVAGFGISLALNGVRLLRYCLSTTKDFSRAIDAYQNIQQQVTAEYRLMEKDFQMLALTDDEVQINQRNAHIASAGTIEQLWAPLIELIKNTSFENQKERVNILFKDPLVPTNKVLSKI